MRMYIPSPPRDRKIKQDAQIKLELEEQVKALIEKQESFYQTLLNALKINK